MNTTLPTLALVAATLFGMAEAGQIYKYVDAQGRMHYADQPQPGWKRVDVRPPTNSQESEWSEPGIARGADLERATECARKQEQIKTYRNAARIVERDSLGRDKEYTADERKQLIEKTEAEVESLCSAVPPGAPPAAAATEEFDTSAPAESAPMEEDSEPVSDYEEAR